MENQMERNNKALIIKFNMLREYTIALFKNGFITRKTADYRLNKLDCIFSNKKVFTMREVNDYMEEVV